MKKSLALLLALVMIMSVALVGCGSKPAEDPKPATEENTEKPAEDTNAEATEEPLKVALLINGVLGDKSFFDSAANGMKLIKEKYGDKVVTKTVEMTYDQTKWEPTLLDYSDGDWDIIIVGTWQMTEALQEVAVDYPDKKYFIFDTSVNYGEDDYDNIYSIQYKQNEGSFIAGVLAAKMTTSDLELANEEKKVGFLGGMDIPVINDFLVGYIEGAHYIDDGIKVAISYVGSFDDSAKGKEMALAQYNQGVDIGFNVAGQAGLGQLDAAKEVKKYAIGVDSDQAALFVESDKEKANLIATSVLKRVDNSLLRAVDMHLAGTLGYGAAENLGLKEECIGLANNAVYNELVPEEFRKLIKDVEAKIISGDIEVSTAIGMDSDKLTEIKNSVKP